jgi:nucleotide-binding universal stress UspA family protein
MFKKVLIPTDGSALSRKAVAKGIELAKLCGGSVIGFFAAPPATPIVYRDHLPVGYTTPLEHEAMIEQAAAKYLAFIERAANRAGVPYKGVRVTNDYAADAILEAAKKTKSDVIVMSSHGASGLRGVFIGSVTQKVINQSTIPVLIIR